MLACHLQFPLSDVSVMWALYILHSFPHKVKVKVQSGSIKDGKLIY